MTKNHKDSHQFAEQTLNQKFAHQTQLTWTDKLVGAEADDITRDMMRLRMVSGGHINLLTFEEYIDQLLAVSTAAEGLQVIVKSWQIELPTGRYTAPTHMQIVEYIKDVDLFMQSIVQLLTDPIQGLSPTDIIEQAQHGQQLLAVKKSTIQTEVDYLMGRTPTQVSRTLARAASDASAKSARSNSAVGKSADSKSTGNISTGGTSAGKPAGKSVGKSAGKSAGKLAGRTLNEDDSDDAPLATSIVRHKAKGPQPPPVQQVPVQEREPNGRVQRTRTAGRKRGASVPDTYNDEGSRGSARSRGVRRMNAQSNDKVEDID